MALQLQRSYDSNSTKKLVLNCYDELKQNNGTTLDWLENIKFLTTIGTYKSQMSDKSLLEAVIKKTKKEIVLKIGDENAYKLKLKHEYEIYTKLHELKLPGFLHYICYFECDDNLKEINKRLNLNNYETESICKGDGKSLRILMMEYIKNKNMAEYKWLNINQLRSAIKQVVLTMLKAYIETGFRHNDLHAKNVLIKKTTMKEFKYMLDKQETIIETHGIKILLMDFECSSFEQPIYRFYDDMSEYFQSITKYIDFTNNEISTTKINILSWRKTENMNYISNILSLLPLIDNLNIN